MSKIDKKFAGTPALTKEQLQKCKDRLRWYEKRDEDKIRTDQAKNEFETTIYAMREWLNENDNIPFVGNEQQETLLSKLSEEEEWLLDGEGEHASYSEYNQRHFELKKKYEQLKSRKFEFEYRKDAVD